VARDLLREIAHCPIARRCLDEPGFVHPCRTIVGSQEATDWTSFQVPEPWSGEIRAAPILFLSSNPSISHHEEYPTGAWSDDEIADYFAHRFGGGRKQWIVGGTKSLGKDGTYPRRGTRFWISVRHRAAELLEKGAGEVVPGKDYVLTEVVHCKSRNEIGVKEALGPCVERYLDRVLDAAAARVIVCFGSLAAEAVRRRYGLQSTGRRIGPVTIGGQPRQIVFLPHPASRAPAKTLATAVDAADVGILRAALR
jgi:hypothetical protein